MTVDAGSGMALAQALGTAFAGIVALCYGLGAAWGLLVALTGGGDKDGD